MQQDLPTIVSFWHGPLSWLERLCIESFLAHGHRFELYAFSRPEGLPEGAVWRDAGELVSPERLFFYKGRGTVAVFSDLFRLKLLQAGRGIWADCDIYCVRPFPQAQDYLMGFEREPQRFRPGSVNTAVFGAPPDAPLLDDLLSVFDAGPRPLLEPFLPPIRRLEVATRRLLGDKVPAGHLQYGATGPAALTHFVKTRGLLDEVRPAKVFYPVAYEQIPGLMTPGSAVETFIGPQTLAVHIWRSQLTNRGRASMPQPTPGSALAKLCERHAIVPA